MSQLTHSSLLSRLIARQGLSADEARWAFDQIMSGLWTEPQIAGVLVALAVKGETVEEIAGAAAAMRAHVVPVDPPGDGVVDTCGTGGTGISTFNISTAAAIVAAGAGALVAKHGNRTNTRASGSANVLAALGVNLECGPAVEARCLREAGVCFCFAVTHHPAMRYAAPVRKALGVRTVFNVLGPLTNPAGVRRQLMGVPSDALTEPIAAVLGRLGAERAMVVHAADGLDELSNTAPTRVSDLVAGRVVTRTFDAADLGLPRARLEDLLVGSPEESAAAVRAVLDGQPGPRRDIVALNAAAALVVAGRAADLGDGLARARRSIDTGTAKTALDRLVALSNAAT